MRIPYETIAEFDAHKMRPDDREELIAWVKSFGVDPNDVREKGVILQGVEEYELHLTKYVRDEHGRIRIDRARDEAVTEPLVISLGRRKTWPGWLADVYALRQRIEKARDLGVSLSQLDGVA